MPAPERPDEADLLTGPHDERQIVDDAGRAPVVEAHVLEADLASGHDELARVRPVLDGGRPGDGVHAVLHRADLLEEPGDLPQEPVRHAAQAQHNGDADGDGAHRQRRP
ncbi:hypothetical protein BOQ54_00040 [Chelatococcus daeguensis]|uniref:Uncharacterized protein n=1 Tax=Chelatococcus daeguensis TaxID=444444 RepID=A0AAC9JPE6_9HYPH|nr:hypothetical protein BOQ54_00040 [Chelatococcus daeguensis]